MSRYVTNKIQKLQHPTQTRPQYSPHKWTPPKYGSTAPQMAHQPEDSPLTKPAEANTSRQVVGTFLYYERTFNSTMIFELNSIAEEHASSTIMTA